MNMLGGSVDTTLILLVLTAFVLLGSSRLGSCIRVVALQGVLLGYLTLAARAGDASLRAPILAIASTGLKGLAFPWLLSRALRDADVRREVEPIAARSPALAGRSGLAAAAFARPEARVVRADCYALW